MSTGQHLSTAEGLQRSVTLMQTLGAQADAIWPLLDPEDAERIRRAMHEPIETDARGAAGNTASKPCFWSSLSSNQIKRLAKILERESPQVTAIVLSKLPSDLASELISSLPERRAAAALHRLAHLGTVLEAALNAIERALSERLNAATDDHMSPKEERVAEILDGISSDRERRLLAALERQEAGIRKRITEHMFRFEDLPQLNPASLQTLIARTDRDTLIAAMKSAPSDVETVILSNMTQRAADLLKSEIAATSPESKVSDKARRDIVRLVRTLAKNGEVMIDQAEHRALVE